MNDDQAMLLWFEAFYTDEAVVLMDDAQLGAFHRLLWHAWKNDGLPGDPKVIAKILGKSPASFVRRVWPALERCWPVGDDGRRRNSRQERERQACEERRAARGGDPSDPDDRRARRSEAGRVAARARWGRRSGSASDPQCDSHANADANACESQMRSQCVSHPSPKPPSLSKENQGPADACASHPQSHASARREQGSEPEAEPCEEGVERLVEALAKTPYRRKLKGASRARELRLQARTLQPLGLTASDVEDLAEVDRQESRVPGALLATLLDRRQWESALAQRRRRRERPDLHLVQQGLGAGEPKLAASVIEAAVRHVAGGGV